MPAKTTNPAMLFISDSWDVEYVGSVEPDADTPVWTLTGTDHATVATGVLEIDAAGTDQNSYYRSLTGISADDCICIKLRFKIETGWTGDILHIRDTVIGKRLDLNITADAVLRFEGASNDDVALTMTSYNIVYVLLHAGGYVAFTGDGSENLTKISEGTAATEAASSLIAFGKVHTTDVSEKLYIDYVNYDAPGDSIDFSYPPKGWGEDDVETQRFDPRAWDGTVETIFAHNKRQLQFETQALTDAQAASLRALYDTYMSHGAVFYVADDDTNLDGSWFAVKYMKKRLGLRRDAECPLRQTKRWKLEVIE